MNIPEVSASFGPIERVVAMGAGSRVMLSAVEVGLFDSLAAGETPVRIASRLGTETAVVESMLRVLAQFGLVECNGDGYRNSRSAEAFLVSDSPCCQISTVRVYEKMYAEYLSSLTDRLTGVTAPDRDETDKVWASRERLESMGKIALHGPLQDAVAFVSELDGFEKMTSMCDIGGNHGFYSMGILDRNPAMHSTVFDLPHVVEAVREVHVGQGYGDRMDTHPGNFDTDELPAGYDLIFASHIMYRYKHDLAWAFSKMAEALRPGGWLVTHHLSLDGEDWDYDTALIALTTSMAGYDSHFLEREELTAAAEKAGLSDVRLRRNPATRGLLFAARRK